ncbi:hypothetical protein [Streptomyces sp. NPDC086023]|uniref:hypothetical protein n=1 Tax=Streptomyces sp. NPDC086023 TaxID=3365746 RepID=UPI0037D14047
MRTRATVVRAVWSAVVIALLAVLVPLGAVAVWADRVLGDEEEYVVVMAPLAEDGAVRGAVARGAASALARQIEAGPVEAGAERLLGEATSSFVGTEAFRTAWNAANRAAHTAFTDALDGGSGDTVTVDLAPVVAEVKADLTADGVPFVDRIPVARTAITVMEYENLGTLRRGFHVLQNAGVRLPAVTLLLLGASVVFTRRRRALLVAAGTGFAAGGLLLAGAVSVCRRLTLDDLPADVDRAAAGVVYDALTAFLRTGAWAVLGAGLVLALGAWLSGRLPSRERGRISPRVSGRVPHTP